MFMFPFLLKPFPRCLIHVSISRMWENNFNSNITKLPYDIWCHYWRSVVLIFIKLNDSFHQDFHRAWRNETFLVKTLVESSVKISYTSSRIFVPQRKENISYFYLAYLVDYLGYILTKYSPFSKLNISWSLLRPVIITCYKKINQNTDSNEKKKNTSVKATDVNHEAQYEPWQATAMYLPLHTNSLWRRAQSHLKCSLRITKKKLQLFVICSYYY